jgi:hypothetical protein
MSQKGAGPRSPGPEKSAFDASLPNPTKPPFAAADSDMMSPPATVDCRTLNEVCVKLFAVAFSTNGWVSRGELCFPASYDALRFEIPA